jgi:hypothetical protein
MVGYLAGLRTNGERDLFLGAGVVNGLQVAALKLAWAMGTHTSVCAASPAATLVDDVLEMVGEIIRPSPLVVRDIKGLRSAVDDDSSRAADVIELDPRGVYYFAGPAGCSTLNIERAVRLVSGAGGQARLVGDTTCCGKSMVRVGAEGVALEGLAFVSGGLGNDSACPFRGQQTAVEIKCEGAAVLRGCDLAGMVEVYGVVELRGCVVHDCSQDGVLVAAMGATAVLVDTTVERCFFGVGESVCLTAL